MSDYHTFVDTVTIEKANAMARYQRFRNLEKLLRFFLIVLLLAFLSWSSTRVPEAVQTLKISGKYVVDFSTYVLNPHIIFLIGNAIVLALYVLSRHMDVEKTSTTSVLYENYENTENKSSVNAIEEVEAPVEIVAAEKQIVCKEVSNLMTEKESQVAEKAPVTQIKKLNRTVSEKLEKPKPRKQFRRSETEVRRVAVNSSNRQLCRNLSKFETVDTLSNEDFRLTVEAFIEKQQNFLREQRMAELTL